MKLQIFDVEHGACGLLTADNQTRMMFDCGHNGSTGWRPGTYLANKGIRHLERLVITNYDEDHVSGAPDLFDKIDVRWLFRNESVTHGIINSLKSETGTGRGMMRLFYEVDNTFTGDDNLPRPDFQGLIDCTMFYHRYPLFEDENNLSFLNFLNCNGIGVLFTGDMEYAGWLKMLERQDFRSILSSVNVLMAPHHGRESGCCEEVMGLMTNLFYVVISDKGYQYDTQKTIPFYRRFAKGGPFRGETRRVLTTRRDGAMSFEFAVGEWGPS